MKSILPLVASLLFYNVVFSQAPAIPNYTFFNSGDSVFLEPGALLYIGLDVDAGPFGTNGDLVVRNQAGQNDGFYNDGVISVAGNVYYGGIVNGDDYNNPVLKPANAGYSGYAERLFSFVGNDNTQYIKGFLDQPEQSFYNLAIDKGGSDDNTKVILQTNIRVNGSLLWHPKDSIAATFNHNSSTLFNSGNYDIDNINNGKGVLQTYLSSLDYEIDVTNAAPNSIVGFTPVKSNGAPTVSSIVNRGAQGVGIGGLSRAVNSTYLGSNYVFPIGTYTAGYNPVSLNFTEVPSGTNKVRGLFANGNVGTVNYNRYGNLTCSGQPQWFIFDEFTGGGYWSFDAQNNGNNYKYRVTAYPNGYTTTTDFNNRRILKYSSDITDIPSDDLWTNQVVQPEYLSNPTKIDTVLSNFTTFNNNSACFNDPSSQGVPGGPYSGFSHFQMGGNSSNALPVELISLKAFPVNNEFIRVAWATATEINNKQFDVLRSEDGLNFFKIGEVAGNGTTTEIQNYAYDDKNVLPNTTYYYRLNQVDFDGEEELSNIVSAAITGSANVVISEFVPNPTRETSRLYITSPTDIRLDVSIFNAIGQEIQSSSIELPAGVQTPFAVDGHILAAGNYFVSLKNESFFITRKLVITAH